MNRFFDEVNKTLEAVQKVATIISNDENVEEYVSESFSDEVGYALKDCDFMYAALLVVKECLLSL